MIPGLTDHWTLLFTLALAGGQGLRWWLNRRQATHFRAHRAAVPVRFAAAIPLADHQKAIDYGLARLRLSQLGLAIDTTFLLWLTLGGLLATLSETLHAQWSPLPAGVLLILGVGLIGTLIDLPLSLYSQFVIEERFGFNRMSGRLFLIDLLKQALLGLLIGAPVIALVLWLLGHLGPQGWLGVWVFWCTFMLFMLWAFPTVIAPLFNRFEPLPDGPLKTRIEALMHRCGFVSRGLFVMDGSKRSAHGNAYFTGTGRAKRIVFFDTLIERLSPPEIEAVLAHELGHFHHKHVRTRLLIGFATAFLALAGFSLLLDSTTFHQALGVPTPTHAATLILMFIALPPLLFPAAPISSLLSRRHEFEADRYAAGHSNADDLVSALVKLYRDNARPVTTDALYSQFHDSHPPAAVRIAQLESQRRPTAMPDSANA
jgi:STE24 endopeptidase